MKAEAKHYSTLIFLIAGTAIALSYFGGIPYIFTLIGFSAWAFFGHLVTIDDDMKSGWSNPDGSEPFSWLELLIKAAIFAALCAMAAFSTTGGEEGEEGDAHEIMRFLAALVALWQHIYAEEEAQPVVAPDAEERGAGELIVGLSHLST